MQLQVSGHEHHVKLSAVGFLYLFVCLGSGGRKSKKLKHGLVIESTKR